MSEEVDFYQTKAWRVMRVIVFGYWGHRCLRCGSYDDLHIGHVVPRSLSPELEMEFDNLQVLCESCNMHKSNKTSDDYRDQKRRNPSPEILELSTQSEIRRMELGIRPVRAPRRIGAIMKSETKNPA